MSKLVELFEKHGTLLKIKRARMLFGVDDPPTKMFLVKTGAVKVYHYTPDGKEIMFYLPGPGELVSITPYLKGGEHLANAETLVDSEIYWLPMTQFKSLVNENLAILREIAEILAHKWDEFSDRLEAFVVRDSFGRLAYIILELANKYGVRAAGKISLPFPLTHQDLANLTGMFRETVSLAMQDLTKRKIISRSKQILTVENPQLLEDIAKYGKQAPS